MPTVQTIVYCTASGNGRTQSPCPDGKVLATIDVVTVEPSYLASVTALNAPFDYGLASSIFAFSFSFVLGLYVVSKSYGVVLSAIKRF